MTKRFIVLASLVSAFLSACATAGEVVVKDDQLFVDGVSQPQLFGAEVQYFRLRGGSGRNIPREKVIALWNQALDRLVEAKANAISFYVPWDFHEYAPGKFDFDGTVDEDGDGKPDYPSRDLKTWLKLVEAHGIKHILVRPGPYVNAEWGFLGFGAVPLWFHERYPDSHMQNSKGQRTFLYGYNDPEFLHQSQIWMETLYREVLAPYIGKGRPIDFLQLDNETNFQWQSIYNVDYSPRAIADYQLFLQATYGKLEVLNARHGRTWHSWSEIKAPSTQGENLAEDQDWYRFQDQSIHTFLGKVRTIWENLGVREPTVMFTLAESYNAADHGLLPNYELRNDPGKTGLMTVNLYPKTAGSVADSLLNNPFKADHDVKADTAANAHYYGSPQQWAMGPEIQGGWFRGTDVSIESRKQTYLSTIGHGLKALFVYYFNEGNNWEYDWAKKQIDPYYQELKSRPEYTHLEFSQLPDPFWTELNKTFDEKVLAGWDTRRIMTTGGTQTEDLYFDAPLDGDAQPRPPFQLLKDIGEKVVAPYGQFLGSAVELNDQVCLIKDHHTNVDSPIKDIDSLTMNSTWAGGLVGYLLHAGVNPKILHWGLSGQDEFTACQLIVFQDNGIDAKDFLDFLGDRLNHGATVLGFLNDSVFQAVVPGGSTSSSCHKLANAQFELSGYSCSLGAGHFYQVNNPIYKDFNTDAYARITDVPSRRAFLEGILTELKMVPQIRIVEGADRVVAFARVPTVGKRSSKASIDKLWVTVKSSRTTATDVHVQWTQASPTAHYSVTSVMDNTSQTFLGSDLMSKGFEVALPANGSNAFYLEVAPNQ